MRYSRMLGRTTKKAPKDEMTANAKLLTRAGYVDKLMAGVYTYLPLGLKVVNKIEQIVREEMSGIGGQEVLMPALHPAVIWKQSKGWEKIDVLFKLRSRTGREYALGQSHEEVVTPLVKEMVSSYRDLPLYVYQLQNKFRDELRAKSGILRGREFLMKDMYSFHLDQADFERFYEEAKQAYLRVFSRAGLTAKVTEASGGSFTEKISYEFMVLTDAGEDDILYCSACDYCVNTEIAKVKEGTACPKCRNSKLKKARASEVGNVFDLGQKYTRDFDFYVLDQEGRKVYPIMGCYGIGISRLMGVVAEHHHDDRGLVWPESVAPLKAHLTVAGEDEKAWSFADLVYRQLGEAGIEVLFDDRRDLSAGERFADADLIGLPWRLVISAKTVGEKKIELKRRTESTLRLVDQKELQKVLRHEA